MPNGLEERLTLVGMQQIVADHIENLWKENARLTNALLEIRKLDDYRRTGNGEARKIAERALGFEER